MSEIGLFANHAGLSAAMIAGTTFFHAVCVAAAGAILRFSARPVWGPVRFIRDSLALVALTLWLIFAHAIEIGAWAALYLRFGLFEGAERAYYFAASCFTTLGFGDVLLPEGWGLLAGANAANGFILFGLSAAFLVEAATRLRLAADSPR